jgi:hypothetical protein
LFLDLAGGAPVHTTPPSNFSSQIVSEKQQETQERIETRDERRRRLADLVGRLLARQWVTGVLVKPMPVKDSNCPP